MTKEKTTKADCKCGWKSAGTVTPVDQSPYLIAHSGVVYAVNYSTSLQRYMGFGYNERVQPDYVFVAPEVPNV